MNGAQLNCLTIIPNECIPQLYSDLLIKSQFICQKIKLNNVALDGMSTKKSDERMFEKHYYPHRTLYTVGMRND
jgi:hypothetical protein